MFMMVHPQHAQNSMGPKYIKFQFPWNMSPTNVRETETWGNETMCVCLFQTGYLGQNQSYSKGLARERERAKDRYKDVR